MSGRVTASIVLYNQSAEDMGPLFRELVKQTALSEWAVVNNGGSEEACAIAKSLGGQCLHPGRNLGFGAGHNLALRELASDSAPYHLILNPDIRFQGEVLAELAAVMDAKPQVGLAMPRVVYPDGSIQRLCKLLPSPVDLVLRRFARELWPQLFRGRMSRYDMQDFDYSQPACVPVLSGCFMFCRRSILEFVDGFDERFFLYMEDTDLCRRMGDISELLFWPFSTVIHSYAQGSYRDLHLLHLHVRSAITYFNKWGWFHDPIRRERNRIGLTDTDIDPVQIEQLLEGVRAEMEETVLQ